MGLSSKIEDINARRAVQNLELRMNKVQSPTYAGLVIDEIDELPSPAIEGKIVRLVTDSRLYFGKAE